MRPSIFVPIRGTPYSWLSAATPVGRRDPQHSLGVGVGPQRRAYVVQLRRMGQLPVPVEVRTHSDRRHPADDQCGDDRLVGVARSMPYTDNELPQVGKRECSAHQLLSCSRTAWDYRRSSSPLSESTSEANTPAPTMSMTRGSARGPACARAVRRRCRPAAGTPAEPASSPRIVDRPATGPSSGNRLRVLVSRASTTPNHPWVRPQFDGSGVPPARISRPPAGPRLWPADLPSLSSSSVGGVSSATRSNDATTGRSFRCSGRPFIAAVRP